MRLFVYFMLFLYLVGLFIASNHGLALADAHARSEFGKLYFEWGVKVGMNLGAITGNAIKLDWLPHEQNVSLSQG